MSEPSIASQKILNSSATGVFEHPHSSRADLRESLLRDQFNDAYQKCADHSEDQGEKLAPIESAQWVALYRSLKVLVENLGVRPDFVHLYEDATLTVGYASTDILISTSAEDPEAYFFVSRRKMFLDFTVRALDTLPRMVRDCIYHYVPATKSNYSKEAVSQFLYAALKHGLPLNHALAAVMTFCSGKINPTYAKLWIEEFLKDNPTVSNAVARSGVGILVVSEKTNTTLLLRRARGHDAGKLCNPGGKVDFGEKAITAAIRELQEETQLVVTEDDLVVLGHYDHIDMASNHHFAGPAYLYVLKEGDSPVNMEPEKHSQFVLMDIDHALNDELLCDPVREAILMYKKYQADGKGNAGGTEGSWKPLYHFFDLPKGAYGCPLTGQVYYSRNEG